MRIVGQWRELDSMGVPEGCAMDGDEPVDGQPPRSLAARVDDDREPFGTSPCDVQEIPREEDLDGASPCGVGAASSELQALEVELGQVFKGWIPLERDRALAPGPAELRAEVVATVADPSLPRTVSDPGTVAPSEALQSASLVPALDDQGSAPASGSDDTLCRPGESQHATADMDPRAGMVKDGTAEAAPDLQTERYSILHLLGEGGYGRVFLAHDNELEREVAIKVPRAAALASDTQAEDFLKEARLAAGLKHPSIVTVYDVVRVADGTIFVVLEYVAGRTLAALLLSERPTFHRAVALVARVADAVHYAHTQGLVHRDIKPGNILIDAAGAPFVADFGLAIREAGQRLRASEVVGTPAYMAPEQVRGETHRLDGRTDVWSLGVVLYLLLTGRLPFGRIGREVFDDILSRDPRPPRQVVETIPRELERIALKCLSKRMTDRYARASDLADDLRYWMASATAEAFEASGATVPVRTADSSSARGAHEAGPEFASKAPVPVVPKGLRSFDASDAFFYLTLVPGPLDREGLPPPVRFWKARVEATDADDSFSVGLLYGPSGCGKSSLIQAGLIPRLAGHVRAIYLEASADETEARLVRGLRKVYPALSERASPAELLLTLREGPYRGGEKVVLFIDQFEQWLHANRAGRKHALAEALRHCDGKTVQCVLMVRDDFGMAAMRFMNELEVPVVEGRNYALVDLFDELHAAKVLTLFGRAYGRLPEHGALSLPQERFVERAVASMAEDGKVVPVRLSLFAEMLRGKPWDPDSLKKVGGAEGVGVAFLEETLGSESPDLRHRTHEQAAQRVLRALLPEQAADLKGLMRRHDDLLAISGYTHTPERFEDLIRVLHVELRLIMPADPERGAIKGEPSRSTVDHDTADTFYQLTHDYLVPVLRKWLTRKQGETPRGRAALLLEERAALWASRPEDRYLPSFTEWAAIILRTARSDRTGTRARMMHAATRRYALWAMAVASLAAVVLVAGWTIQDRFVQQRVATLTKQLLESELTHVPRLLGELKASRPLWRDRMAAVARDPSRPPAEATRAHLALVGTERESIPFLIRRLLGTEPKEHRVIRDELVPWKSSVVPSLRSTATDPEETPARRLRAASALVAFDARDPHLNASAGDIARALLREELLQIEGWAADFDPLRRRLTPALVAAFRDPKLSETDRLLATNLLARYARDDTGLLSDLCMDADERAYAMLFPILAARPEPAVRAMRRALAVPLPAGAEEGERAAKRRANAAITLLRLNDPEPVWPWLRAGPDPTVRTYLIHRMLAYGVPESRLLDQLATTADPTIRSAILLTLGERPPGAGREALRERIVTAALARFSDDENASVHSAAEWVLWNWGESKRLKLASAALHEEGRGNWSITCQGQTMITIHGPITFRMGSTLETDLERDPGGEDAHLRRIPRSFAISAHEITIKQFLTFAPGSAYADTVATDPACPMLNVSWYNAARYCRWLSECEGIAEDQMCFPALKKIGPGMELPDNLLERTGYRLPTEAEWEAACRAGTETSRPFGRTAEMIRFYAWCIQNSPLFVHPVGSLRPNAWGLFDCLGNVGEWCYEEAAPYPSVPVGGHHDDNPPRPRDDRDRAFRGGSRAHAGPNLRSAMRYHSVMPKAATSGNGFRVARTVRH